MKAKDKSAAARAKLRKHFGANVGKVLSTHVLAKVAGISDYQRRIRELRNEEGMKIRSHKDNHNLKPGEYMLESLELDPVIARSISAQLRMEILDRNGFTCQLCGATGGDPDPTDASKKVRLVIDHIVPISQGGTNERSNLRALCTACNQGRSNLETPTETVKNILARIRKLTKSDQKQLYKVLHRTYGATAED